MSLKTLLFPCLGPVLFQKIGPWNGIRPQPTLMIPSDVVLGLSMTSILTACCESSRMFSAAKNHNSCNVILCDVKDDGDCISALTFVWGNLIDPVFGGLSGRYPTGQGIIPFEARWSP
jgi:hypothetical protein